MGTKELMVTAALVAMTLSASSEAKHQGEKDAPYPKQDSTRVEAIAAHLPELPGTPAPRPSNRADWAFLATDSASVPFVDEAAKRIEESIPELADELYLEFLRNGNRSRYEVPFFRRLVNLNLFMLAEALEWNGRFVPGIKRYLEAILDEKTWTVPAHDRNLDSFEGRKPLIRLFSAQRAWVVAYAIDWFGEVLPPDLVARAKAECRHRIVDPYLKACGSLEQVAETGCSWFFGSANWTPVCHAGCVATALILAEDRRERATCIEAAERAMPYYFSGFTEDGYCSEGMDYWNYGFGNYTALVSLVGQATGWFVDLGARMPKVARVAAYAMNFQLEPGLSPHFADGGGNPERSLLEMVHRFWPDSIPASAANCPLLAGTTTNYGQYPACNTLAMRAFGPKGWRGTKVLSDTLAARTEFDCAQVYLMRPGDGKEGLALALKGGHNAEFHNHNDVGTYAISLNGEILAGDVGGEAYTARTFSSQRYDSDVLSSFGHPVPRIGGGLQPHGRQYAAQVLRKSFLSEKDEVVLDLRGAYSCPALERLERTFIYNRAQGAVTIRDEVAFSEPTAVDVPFTTLARVMKLKHAPMFVLVGQKSKLMVKVCVEGGDWSWDKRTLENGCSTTPRRVAVAFDRPVTAAIVEFTFTPMVLD